MILSNDDEKPEAIRQRVDGLAEKVISRALEAIAVWIDPDQRSVTGWVDA
jgi:hypothetical protein